MMVTYQTLIALENNIDSVNRNMSTLSQALQRQQTL